jgi:NAD(P)-dependent dehydrogenase (short-subunit alcohol dehydrogenase family)
MGRYASRKAVIIGGTQGMGFATAKLLLEGGGEVLVTGRNEKHLEVARQELGPRAHAVRSDIASLTDTAALAKTVEVKLGRVDFVFINAGFARLGMFEQVTEDVYDRTFDINAKGAYFTAQRLAPLVKEGGALVFTTSAATATGVPGMSVYSGAKAAVRSFAQGLAAELLPRGIRVNVVSPGFIKTPTMGVDGASAEELAAFEKEGNETTPMGRIGTAEEVARAALFLAFEATFTTGAELLVDGGATQLSVPPRHT